MYISRVAPLMLLLIVGVPSLAFADATTECAYPHGDGNFPTLGCCGGEDERLCVQDDWWNFSDAPELCDLGLVASDFYTCARPRTIGENCGPLAPCGDFIGAGGDKLSLSCLPFVQECMPAAEDTEAEIFPPELCEAFRSQPFQLLASELNVTMSYGLSQSAAAGVSESFEVGAVYAPDGRYGCYLAQCLGGGLDLSLSIGACAGLTSPFSAFPGNAETITVGGSTPIAQVGFSVTTSVPPGVSTSACFNLGIGPLPVDGTYANCNTFVQLVEGAFDPVTGDRISQPPPPRYWLSVTTGGTGTGSVERDTEECTGLPGCAYGTVVTLTAKPDTAVNGSTFAGWSGYLCEGTGEECTVNVTDNMRVTAMFTNTPEYVTVVKEGTGYCAVSLRESVFWDNYVTCIFEDSQDDGPDGPSDGQTRAFAKPDAGVSESLNSCTIPILPDENGVYKYSVLERSPCSRSGFPSTVTCGGDNWDLDWEDRLGFPAEYGFDVNEAKISMLTGWGGDGSTGTDTSFQPEVSDYFIKGIKGSFGVAESATVVIRCEKEAEVDLRIIGRRTPEPNAFGWNKSEVAVSFDCFNSSVDLLPGDQIDRFLLESEVEGHSVTGLCADEFGFTVEETISDINIDLTPPTVVMPPDLIVSQTDPDGTQVYFAALVSDALSGVDDGLADCSFCSEEYDFFSTDSDEKTDLERCKLAGGTLFPAISGMRFPPGLTTVNCQASDRADNIVKGSFKITVVDDTAPTLILSSPIIVDATDRLGAAVPYTVSANDGEGFTESGIPQTIEVIPSCSPASGSVFPIGSSVVSCSATDRAGNAATGEFSVTVRKAVVTTKKACKKAGWKWHIRSDGLPFKNEGDCIQYVLTGK